MACRSATGSSCILWEEDGLTQRELSVRAGMMEPTTFAAVTALERLGYVSRSKRGDNRKNMFVALTQNGKALKAKLVPLAEAVNEAAVRGIDPRDIAVTRRTLLALIHNLASDEAGADLKKRGAARAVA